MASSDISLGSLELEVLKIVWQGHPCTVQDVFEVLKERRGLAKTTVLTVMQRLHGKGLLRRRKVEGIHRYSPTEGRREVLSKLIRQFLDRVLDGSPVPFVAYLAEVEDLDEQQISALREIARDLDERGGNGNGCSNLSGE